jgi:hypothetical protein
MLQFRLVQVDITRPENKPWFAKYRYDIPVLHLNGAFLAKHRITLDFLNESLTSAERGERVAVAGDPNPQLPAPPTPLD